jgi:hypothetical protein
LNTNKFLFCDNFEHSAVSKLSLLLFDNYYILFAKNGANEVLSVIQENFESSHQLQKLLSDHEIFLIDCDKTVFWMGGNFTLVPESFYQVNKLEPFGYFIEEDIENYDLISSPKINGIYVLNSIPRSFNKIFINNEKLKIIPGVTNLLAYILEQRNPEKDEVFVSCYLGTSYISVLIEGKLHLLNKFQVEDNQEIVHYIFGITHQLGLQHEKFDIYFLGNLASFKIDQEWIDSYFHKGFILNPDSNLDYLGETLKIKENEILEVSWQYV